ncbi:MAG: hypothetical protein HN742_11025 [Lentisphaerae bacterium]|jgi:hypothetical protein|nr:hypothetical protein [Lentisphaerota bacterium]MBT4819620.1 hypothetical protein [Lentisphaerota bacterium]MBT5607278.1 hypothetical protein [Lentisphaerota bacterium]MBT7058793.1 hypothetical protein [Lentisphaerota bacterium]MBT7842397.1 hypothetical protein [Lentisphaerota bacterium]
MNTEDRNRFIAQKLDEGFSLSDVQKALADEHDVQMTYLDLRLAAADLEVDWTRHDKVVPEPEEDEADAAPEPQAQEAAATGMTTITVSKLVRPGASMSGDVEFASGAKAEWFVDSMGRLGLNPAPGSGKPTEDDIQEFQIELQRKLTGGA